MEKLFLRGRGLLRRPLYSACGRWRPIAIHRLSHQHQQQPQPRRAFSCTSRVAANVGNTTDPSSQNSSKNLPDGPYRTRFAPSPTGYLHLGSLRTALYNYLLARGTGGQFVLRVEDTDQSRLVGDAEEKLYRDLKWAGLSWDEGPDRGGPYGPYRQSERLPLYQEHADKLVREGKAYRCFCSPDALEDHKKVADAFGQSTAYPGTCRGISLEESDDRAHKGEAFAIRFRSGKEPLMIQDLTYKRFRKRDPEDDYIIMKRDGFPTYHFANVVDDHHMKITHVVRGAEWLVSTPKHVELYNAFDWQPPKFAHLGLLVGKDRQKLSKRDMSATLDFYESGHVHPAALLNFALLLGWRTPPKQSDAMSLEEMVNNFSFNFTKGDIIVSLSKLPFLQEKHLQRVMENPNKTVDDDLFITNHFIRPLRAAMRTVQKAKDDNILLAPGDLKTAEIGEPLPDPLILNEEGFRVDLARIVGSVKVPLHRPQDRFPNAMFKLRYYLWDVPEGVLEMKLHEGKVELVQGPSGAAQMCDAVEYLREKLTDLDDTFWVPAVLEGRIREFMADEQYWKFFPKITNAQKKVYQPLRWALLAMETGLPMWTTMAILGKSETLRRLEVARSAADRVAAEPWPEPEPVPSEAELKEKEKAYRHYSKRHGLQNVDRLG